MRRLALLAALALGGCFLRYVAPALCIGDPSGDTISHAPAAKPWTEAEQKAFTDCVAKVADAGTAWDGRLPCP